MNSFHESGCVGVHEMMKLLIIRSWGTLAPQAWDGGGGGGGGGGGLRKVTCT